MKCFLKLIPLLTLAACATNPNKVVDLNTRVDKQTEISKDTVIGVKEGNLIYQRKVLIGEELRSLQIKTYESEANLYGGPRYYGSSGLIGVLKNCREKLSMTEDGKVKWSEKRDYVVPEYETSKVGIDESGNLTSVTEEYLNDRIKRFRGYKEVIDQRTEDIEEKISVCKTAVNYKQKTTISKMEGL